MDPLGVATTIRGILRDRKKDREARFRSAESLVTEIIQKSENFQFLWTQCKNERFPYDPNALLQRYEELRGAITRARRDPVFGNFIEMGSGYHRGRPPGEDIRECDLT